MGVSDVLAVFALLTRRLLDTVLPTKQQQQQQQQKLKQTNKQKTKQQQNGGHSKDIIQQRPSNLKRYCGIGIM